MRMSKEIKLGIKKSSRGTRETGEGGRCGAGEGFALRPLSAHPQKSQQGVWGGFTSFGPKLQTWRPPELGVGGSASSALLLPAMCVTSPSAHKCPCGAVAPGAARPLLRVCSEMNPWGIGGSTPRSHLGGFLCCLGVRALGVAPLGASLRLGTNIG